MANETLSVKPTADSSNGVERTRSCRCYRPNCDILETADELLVRADMPGANPGSIDVKFEDGALTIHAKVEERQAENVEYLLHEYGVGDYYRTFEVSEAVDASKITADFSDGVLTLHLPKSEAVKPRKIEVRS